MLQLPNNEQKQLELDIEAIDEKCYAYYSSRTIAQEFDKKQ